MFADENGNIDYEKYYSELNNIYNLDEKSRSEFFGKGNLIAIDKFKDKNVVLDRHLVSNYYWNGNDDLKEYFYSLIDQCGRPDITIYLYASPKVRFERLRSRLENDSDLYDETVFADGLDKSIEFMNDFGFNYVILNTDCLNIKDVFKEVDNIICTYL